MAVETDYSNLEEVIKYCLKNTAKVREIAEAGRRVYLEKLGRDGILDYLATMMTKMNGRVVPDVGSSWNLIDQGGVEPVVVEEVRVEKGKRGVVEEAVAKKRVVVAEEPPVRVPGAEIKVQ